MQDIIRIQHLHKSFGAVRAVQDLSFCVREGDLFAFLGVNGAGKSTTIHILCGQLAKDGGSVEIDGMDIERDPDGIKGKIGVVFQNSVLDAALTVRDNLESRAALYGIVGGAFRRRLAELARLLEFEDLLDRTLGKLSGGQRRRIDIARALLHHPKILVLDEPTAGLDPSERIRFRNLISELSEDRIVLLSTHIVSDVEYIANKILLMQDGRLVLSGTSEDIIASMPESVWVSRVSKNCIDICLKKFKVSNVKNIPGGAELRIISRNQPTENAVRVDATLEDVFLYYFGERAGDDDDTV